MSTIKPLAMYQNSTKFGGHVARQRATPAAQEVVGEPEASTALRSGRAYPYGMPSAGRSCPFLVQLMMGNEAHMRGVLGRADVADRRESAYQNALEANRLMKKAADVRDLTRA